MACGHPVAIRAVLATSSALQLPQSMTELPGQPRQPALLGGKACAAQRGTGSEGLDSSLTPSPTVHLEWGGEV